MPPSKRTSKDAKKMAQFLPRLLIVNNKKDFVDSLSNETVAK